MPLLGCNYEENGRGQWHDDKEDVARWDYESLSSRPNSMADGCINTITASTCYSAPPKRLPYGCALYSV
ncbi:hypothetical protein ACLOJK_033116 [Asimina triloba]